MNIPKTSRLCLGAIPIPLSCTAKTQSFPCCSAHPRNARLLLSPELQSVADEVLKQPGQLRLVTIDGWGGGEHSTTALAFWMDSSRLPRDGLNQAAAVDRFEGSALHVNPGIVKQVIDQPVHPLGAVYGVAEKLPAVSSSASVYLSRMSPM